MATIGNMVVNVLARTTGFTGGMRRAGRSLTTYQKHVLAAHRTTQRFHKLLGLVGVSLGASRMISGLRETAAEIDNIAKTSQKLGIATERLAGLQYAGQLTGVEARTLSMALQRMVRRVSEAAAGLGEAREALKELRLEAAMLNRLSPDQQFLTIADALRAVENQSDRVRLAFKLFDSEGVSLVQTLQHGSAAIRNWMTEAEQIGATFTGEEAAQIEALNDALTKLGAGTRGLKTQILIDIAPGAERAVASLADTMKGLRLRKQEGRPGAGQMFMEDQMPWTLGAYRWVRDLIADQTDAMIRQDIRQGFQTGSPHQVGGTSAEQFRQPHFLGRMVHQRDADFREHQTTMRQVGAWLRGGVTERLQGAAGHILDWARRLPEQVDKLEEAGRSWALSDLAGTLLGRGANTREFFRRQEQQQQQEAQQQRMREQMTLGRAINRALEEGTQEFYRESLANVLGQPLQKQELAESKKQTGHLQQLVAFARQAPQVQMVAIPQ